MRPLLAAFFLLVYRPAFCANNKDSDYYVAVEDGPKARGEGGGGGGGGERGSQEQPVLVEGGAHDVEETEEASRDVIEEDNQGKTRGVSSARTPSDKQTRKEGDAGKDDQPEEQLEREQPTERQTYAGKLEIRKGDRREEDLEGSVVDENGDRTPVETFPAPNDGLSKMVNRGMEFAAQYLTPKQRHDIVTLAKRMRKKGKMRRAIHVAVNRYLNRTMSKGQRQRLRDRQAELKKFFGRGAIRGGDDDNDNDDQ